MKVGLMHNDLKPSNLAVRIVSNGNCKLILIDFDISDSLTEHIMIDILKNHINFLLDKRNLDLFDLYNYVKIRNTIDINRIKGYTEEYEAPEIFNNKEKINKQNETIQIMIEACQIYSLGVILLEAIGFLSELHNKNDY